MKFFYKKRSYNRISVAIFASMLLWTQDDSLELIDRRRLDYLLLDCRVGSKLGRLYSSSVG